MREMDNILVLNAGSSSLKFALYGGSGAVLARGQVAGIGAGQAEFTVSRETTRRVSALTGPLDTAGAQDALFGWLSAQGLGSFAAIGHRVVHGGDHYTAPVLVTDAIAAELDGLRRRAPLHMPFGLEVMARARMRVRDVPHVACFDTAFHTTQPTALRQFPLPAAYEARGYRRYGYHGLNYEHVATAFARLTDTALPDRVIVAHLGAGASMCALKAGRSLATTMGYSTLDGLVMETRCGTIDPGLLIALQQDGMSLEAVTHLLYHDSGLKALSGGSGSMKSLLSSADSRAAEAVEHFCIAAARHAAGLGVVLGGIDALVFTGGIGENAAPGRA